MEIIVSSQSEPSIIQAILAFGTALAGIGTCLMAYFTFRAIRRQENKDRPLAVVSRGPEENIADGKVVIVSNVGSVSFTVIETGIGGVAFRYHDPFAIDSKFNANRKGTRTIAPGDHARFSITHDNGGPAYAKLADGTVFREKNAPKQKASADCTAQTSNEE